MNLAEWQNFISFTLIADSSSQRKKLALC